MGTSGQAGGGQPAKGWFWTSTLSFLVAIGAWATSGPVLAVIPPKVAPFVEAAGAFVGVIARHFAHSDQLV